MFPRMNGRQSHNDAPSVIVNNFHVGRPPRPGRPLKADSPLIVNANAVLALAIPGQGFEAVAGERCKISNRGSSLQTIELQSRGSLESRECLDSLPGREIPSPLVPIAENHWNLRYQNLLVTSSVTKPFLLQSDFRNLQSFLDALSF